MKSWIHEIAESYVAGHKPVRRDLKENYTSLTEEQQFALLSENVLNYLDEQLQNAFGIGIGDLTEEEMKSFIQHLLEFDPNRGATGRAVPIVYTAPEGGSMHAKAQKRGLNFIGKRARRLATLSPESKDLYLQYDTGRNFRDRFRGSSLSYERTPTTPEELKHEENAERAFNLGQDVGRDPKIEAERKKKRDAEMKVYKKRMDTGTTPVNYD